MGTDLDAVVALGTFFTVPGDDAFHDFQGAGRTSLDAGTTMNAGLDGLWIMAVGTVEVAFLDKDGGSRPGPIYGRDGNNVIDGDPFH